MRNALSAATDCCLHFKKSVKKSRFLEIPASGAELLHSQVIQQPLHNKRIELLKKAQSIALQAQIIPLRQKIEHCQRYLEIQEKRYKDRFEVTWDVPETLMQYKTLKILLQPIVENCIYHAIKPLSTKGHIHIQGALEEKALLLRVQDDGLGMDAVKLSERKEILKSESIRQSRHLGIANVSQRIRLYFGEEYGVTIESQPLVGTTVTVRIPQIVEPVLK